MIYPTLFIGLGSTGLDILEKFQELVLEHYGKASLDVFKYISIETREAVEVKRSDWGENQIKLIKPVIRSTDAIANGIRSGHKDYLKPWLNQKLLEIDGGQFIDGASNIRMAGRLILWENWDIIKKEINDAYRHISAVQNKNKTTDFLKIHYARHGTPIDANRPLVGSKPNVYVLGTLCGGTCSGMFIDIGYYVKQITGLWARNLENPNIAKTIGVFSLFDAASLTSAKSEGVRKHAANAWSALMEYDFYCHPQTRYRLRFPGETEEIDTHERPIDMMYLTSCTATDSNNLRSSNFVKGSSPDIKSLNHMSATILFTETVGNLLEQKQAIRTDYRGRPRAIERNKGEHSPCIATCGIATIWYPKYRIALGAACSYGIYLCNDWLKEPLPNTKQVIEKEITNQWYDMLNRCVDELTSTPTGTLVQDVEQEIQRDRDDYFKGSNSQFKNRILSSLEALNKGKKFDTHISDPGRLKSFKEKLKKEVVTFITQIIDTEGSLSYAQYYLKHLDKAVAQSIAQMPQEYPAANLGILGELKNDPFSKLVFRAKEVQKQRREEILKDVTDYMTQAIKRCRNFHMRPVLEEIQQEIGISKPLSDEKIKAGMLTLDQHLKIAKRSLTGCIEALENQYENLSSDFSCTQNVKVVSEGVPEVIKDDIDKLTTQLRGIALEDKEKILAAIIGEHRLSEFLGFGIRGDKSAAITGKIREQLIRELLRRTESFDVVEHVMQNWTPADLAAFSLHGLPHLELSPGPSGLASVRIGSTVSFTAGGNQAGLERLLDEKLAGTESEGIFGRNEKSPVYLEEMAHMLMFYREEPLMYMDENLATATLFKQYYRDSENTSVYGLHSHKGGKNFYDPQIYARKNKCGNELMPVAIKILSTRDDDGNWTASEIFGIEKKRLVFRGRRENKLKFRFTADESGVDICAQDKEVFDIFNNLIEEKLKNMKKEEFIDRVNNFLDQVEKQVENEEQDPGPIIEAERKEIMEIPLVKNYFPEDDED
jgi:Tubulin like